ncbi:MAG: SlyX family protein [Gammaproteobacteria bacterium]|nr:SlyX family protein [Gammaproteobacteria bacterium]
MDDSTRIADLEARLAFQEDTLTTLDAAVYGQQRRIDALERLCERLAARLRDAVAAGPDLGADPRPPHY